MAKYAFSFFFHVLQHPLLLSLYVPANALNKNIKGIGSKERRDETTQDREERQKKISEAVRTILSCIGEDPDREGLLKTPDRYAKALLFFTKGYEQNIRGMHHAISGEQNA